MSNHADLQFLPQPRSLTRQAGVFALPAAGVIGIGDASLYPIASDMQALFPGLAIHASYSGGADAISVGGRGNSILLRLTNTGDQPASGTLKLDIKGLDVNVRKVWAEFTNIVPQDGKGSAIAVERADQPRNNNQLVFNAYAGEIYYNLSKGHSRVFSIDRY